MWDQLPILYFKLLGFCHNTSDCLQHNIKKAVLDQKSQYNILIR